MNVLVTDRFDIEAFSILKTGRGLAVSRSESTSPTDSELANTDVMVVRSRTEISKELLARAPKLKLVITSTSGYDHIDLDAARERKVAVSYTPNANAASACELTWGLVLSAARKLNLAHRAVKNTDWNREPLMGTQLGGKTYGIIGLGRIGSRVARVAQAFGMKTVAYDPYHDDEYFLEHGCERVGLDELFRFADVVSCHVPKSDETNHMISPILLSEGNQGLIFVNTSRGSVIKDTVLVDALDNGSIGACGLDVFEKEPVSKESKLLKRENVVLSPHIGASTHEAFQAASREAAEKVLAFANGGTLSDLL